MKYTKYNKDELQLIVEDSDSYREVLRKLGKAPVGGNSTYVKNLCIKWNIDTSHMRGQAHQRGQPAKNKVDPISRLVLGERLDGRTKAHYLREGLIALGRPYQCFECGIGDMWNNKPIVLEVHHKDNQFWNNQPENLEFTCPNCHSQQD